MITRRQGREWVLQALVQFDLNPPQSVDDALSSFWGQLTSLERENLENGEFGAHKAFTATKKHDVKALAEMQTFAERRIRGAWGDRDALDAALTPCMEHWSIYRLGSVERSVLRLGAWELKNCAEEIPAAIAINEAVDLVKYFSENRSGRFVNGVLDRFSKMLHEKPKEDKGEDKPIDTPEHEPDAPKKALPKKTSAKKPLAKKPLAKKPLARKPLARKPLAKKPFAKKTLARKPFARKPLAKKRGTAGGGGHGRERR